MTAVQELTRAAYQARVLALLEALASAMPGPASCSAARSRRSSSRGSATPSPASASIAVLVHRGGDAAAGRVGARARAGARGPPPRPRAARAIEPGRSPALHAILDSAAHYGSAGITRDTIRAASAREVPSAGRRRARGRPGHEGSSAPHPGPAPRASRALAELDLALLQLVVHGGWRRWSILPGSPRARRGTASYASRRRSRSASTGPRARPCAGRRCCTRPATSSPPRRDPRAHLRLAASAARALRRRRPGRPAG